MTELDVLGVVSDRLSANGIACMLTGSFALPYCATPRMTRALDIVVAEINLDYIHRWASRLGVAMLLGELMS
jgi:hypothetical protein